jgi:hypothetical protein
MITYTIILNGRRHDISLYKDELKNNYLHLLEIYKVANMNPPPLIRYVKWRFHDLAKQYLLITDL